jgi:hypothetical protein
MVPTVTSEKWREGVRAHHAKRRAKSQKIEPGMVFRFADGYKDSTGESMNGVEAEIVKKSGRSYIAKIGYMEIKIQRRHIGEILFADEQAA